jgi:hypothetical protein
MADDRAQARREAATLLGVDVEHLSPADSLRVDMVSALRLVIDAEQATVLSGGSADLGKLNVAVQSLIALLPGKELPEPVSSRADPRQIMWETYKRMRERGAQFGQGYDGLVLKVKALEAEIERLKAGAPVPEEAGGANATSSGATAPVGGNVVRLSRPTNERTDATAAPPKPAPPPAAPAAPLPPAAPQYDYNTNQDWKSWVNSDGSIRTTPRGRWDI